MNNKEVFTFKSIRKRNAALDKVTVHSFDMSLYLVELDVGENKGMLVGDDKRPLHFRSVEEVRDKMSEFHVLRAELRHDSPFDEMIGNPDSASQPLVIPLSWSDV
jgi:hypothetical protein